MDIWQRRGLLNAVNNPDRRLDYICALEGKLSADLPHKNLFVRIAYVPDTLILQPGDFTKYLDAMTGLEWKHLEDLATTLLNDVANELVARWLKVCVEAEAQGGAFRHQVVLQEKQPQWANEDLIARAPF